MEENRDQREYEYENRPYTRESMRENRRYGHNSKHPNAESKKSAPLIGAQIVICILSLIAVIVMVHMLPKNRMGETVAQRKVTSILNTNIRREDLKHDASEAMAYLKNMKVNANVRETFASSSNNKAALSSQAVSVK
ncbi:MAG TPA: hypothetical protein DEP42_00965 [Ruminococcaceae bacterium]|nr:hypothetical protein [Oscillospiraceae bacterium]